VTVELPAVETPIWQDWYVFLRAYKAAIDNIAQDLADAGMPSLVEYSVLWWLNRHEPHRLRQVDLSKGVLVSKSRVTRLMNDMVEKGYVRREKTSSDKRVTFAVMTEGGKDAYMRATPVFAQSFEKYFASQIAPKDRGEIARILTAMAAQHEPPDPAAQLLD
jgi:DNA-binding MarR family transcriptional regulator